MHAFLTRWTTTTLAVYFASVLVHGIENRGGVMAILLAGLFLAALNAMVRPLLMLLSLPLILATMGAFIFIVNALLLKLVSWLVPGFDVVGFLPAVLGSILISVVSWALNTLMKRDEAARFAAATQPTAPKREMKVAQGRVIEEDETRPRRRQTGQP